MDAIIDGDVLERPLWSRRKGVFTLHRGRHLIVFCEPETDKIMINRVLHDRMYTCQMTSIIVGLGCTYLRQAMTATWRGSKSRLQSEEALPDLQD